MKKTVKINLSGTIFHIDEDAFERLNNYLDRIHEHFKEQEGGEEIIADIEMRMAELFSGQVGCPQAGAFPSGCGGGDPKNG